MPWLKLQCAYKWTTASSIDKIPQQTNMSKTSLLLSIVAWHMQRSRFDLETRVGGFVYVQHQKKQSQNTICTQCRTPNVMCEQPEAITYGDPLYIQLHRRATMCRFTRLKGTVHPTIKWHHLHALVSFQTFFFSCGTQKRKTFLKISICYCFTEKNVVKGWNDTRVTKLRQNFHFWVLCKI